MDIFCQVKMLLLPLKIFNYGIAETPKFVTTSFQKHSSQDLSIFHLTLAEFLLSTKLSGLNDQVPGSTICLNLHGNRYFERCDHFFSNIRFIPANSAGCIPKAKPFSYHVFELHGVTIFFDLPCKNTSRQKPYESVKIRLNKVHSCSNYFFRDPFILGLKMFMCGILGGKKLYNSKALGQSAFGCISRR